MTIGKSPDLEGCWAKVVRAKTHIDTLTEQIKGFLQSDAYAFIPQVNADGTEYIFRCHVVRDGEWLEWALLTGDAIHNLRCALDHLAWRLAGADRADTKTQFPIFLTEADFRRHAPKQVRRMSRDAQALIEALQPFRTPEPLRDALWGLHILNNADKHRLVWITAAAHLRSEYTFIVPDGSPPPRPTFWASYKPLEEDAVVAVIRLADPPKVHVRVNAEFTYSVVFRESPSPAGNTEVVESLRAMFTSVDAVLGLFEREFFSP